MDSRDLRSTMIPVLLHSIENQVTALRVLLDGARAGRDGTPAGGPAVAPEPGVEPGVDLERMAVDGLTPREREVLNLLLEGAPNRAIARSLGISVRTVKAHLGSIFNKLDVSGRAEAIVHVLTNEQRA